MPCFRLLTLRLACLLLLTGCRRAKPEAVVRIEETIPEGVPMLQVRGGLPNVAAKLAGTEPFSIAFPRGSITEDPAGYGTRW